MQSLVLAKHWVDKSLSVYLHSVLPPTRITQLKATSLFLTPSHSFIWLSSNLQFLFCRWEGWAVFLFVLPRSIFSTQYYFWFPWWATTGRVRKEKKCTLPGGRCFITRQEDYLQLDNSSARFYFLRINIKKSWFNFSILKKIICVQLEVAITLMLSS